MATNRVQGVTWFAEYGEISESPLFRIGYLGSQGHEAVLPIPTLADLIDVLTNVTGLPVGVVQRGTEYQARKVQSDLFVDIVLEPRYDNGTPSQIMRYYEGKQDDLLYVLNLLATELGALRQGDWDMSELGPIVPGSRFDRQLAEGLQDPETEFYKAVQDAAQVDSSVTSVNGKEGDVVLDYSDVGAAPASLVIDVQDLGDDLSGLGETVSDQGTTIGNIETSLSDAVDSLYVANNGRLSDPTNMLAGSNFEEAALVPWDMTNLSISSGSLRPHSGTNALYVDGSKGPFSSELKRRVFATEGDRWYAELWASRSGAWDGTSNSGLRVESQDGTYLSDVSFATGDIPVANVGPIKLSRQFVVPAGVTELKVQIQSDATLGAVWLDDLVLRRVPDIAGGLPHSVAEFGAVGDGVTDDSDAIDAALHSGLKVVFEAGKTYVTSRTIGSTNADVYAVGATILSTHLSGNVIHAQGTLSDTVNVTSRTETSEAIAPSGAATIRVQNFTLSSSVPSDWKRGDTLVFVSDDVLTGSKDSGTPSAPQNLRGEFLTFVSGSGTSIKATGVIRESMLTNRRIAKLNDDNRLNWVGGTFDWTDESYAVNSGYTFFITKANQSTIKDVLFKRVKSAAVSLRTCINWRIDNIEVLEGVNDLSRGAFGYGVANFNSAYGILSRSRFTDVRHAYTNGGTFKTAPTTGADGFGRPQDNLITHCFAYNCSAGAFDSHTQGLRETFDECVAVNCGTGFNLRGYEHTVKGGKTVGCVTGFRAFCEGTGGETSGHTIDGLFLSDCERIGDFDVRMVSDGVTYNTRDVAPSVVRNVTAKGLRGRWMTLTNATVFVSNIQIDEHPNATLFGALSANSHLYVQGMQIRIQSPVTAFLSFAVNGISGAESIADISDVTIRNSSTGLFQYLVSGTSSSKVKARDVRMAYAPAVSTYENAYGSAGALADIVIP